MPQILQKIKDEYNKIKAGHISYTKKAIRPTHDWGVILTSVSIIMCIMILSEFYFYVLVDQGKLFSVTIDDSQKEVKINSAILNKVVGDINLREANMLKMNKNELTEPDPSL